MRPFILSIVFIALTSFAAPVTAQKSEASRKVLEAAAGRGSTPAQYALGAAAEQAGDLALALERYRQAAEQGYAGAQFKLGEFFEQGKGVKTDRAAAINWYRNAAAQGLDVA